MAKHQLVKVSRSRQLLAVAICMAFAGCGGDEVDFSKPTAGGNAKSFTWPPPDETSTAATSDEESEDKAGESKTTGESEKTSKSEKSGIAKKASGGVIKIRKSTNPDDDDDYDEEDEDNPYANWRKRPFKLKTIDLAALDSQRRVGFSENGKFLVGADQGGEVIVFETRYGNVRSLIELDKGTPTSVAVSDEASLVLIESGKPGLRIFELRDLSRLDHFARETFNQTQLRRPAYKISETPLTVLQFAMNGRKVITGNEAGQVQIRNVDSWPKHGEPDWPAEVTLDAHEASISAAAISLDGRSVATAGLDGSVKVWDSASGELTRELEPARVPALAICATVDGFAVGRANGVLELWSGIDTDEAKVEEILDRNPTTITSLLVEPKRGFLAMGLGSGAATLIDMNTGKSLSSRKAHRNSVLKLGSAPDKERILTCAADGYYGSWPAIELREARRGQKIEDSDAVNKPVLRFRVGRLSPTDDDEDSVYSATQEAMLASFKTVSDVARKPSEMRKLENQLRSASEADRAVIRAGLGTNKPDAASKKAPELITAIKTNFRMVSVENVRVALSGSGETVALAASPPKGRLDGTIEVWDVQSGTALRKWDIDRAYERIQLAGGGRWIIPFPKPVVRREAAVAGFFDVEKGLALTAVAEPRVVVERDGVFAMGLAGKYGTSGEVAQLLNSASLNQTASFSAFESVVSAIAILPDKKVLVSVRERLNTRLLLMSENLEEEELLFEEKINLPWVEQNGKLLDIMGVTDIAVSPEGSTVVTHGRFLGRDYRFTIWKRKAGRFDQKDARGVKKPISFLLDGLPGNRMTFTNRSTLAVLSPEGLVMVNTESGEAGKTVRLGGQMSVFDPTGRYLLTHDGTGTIGIRSLANAERPPRKFRAHDAPVMAMAFSDSGEFFATVGEENQLKVWRLDDWAKVGGSRKP